MKATGIKLTPPLPLAASPALKSAAAGALLWRMRDMYSSPSSAQCRGTGMCSKDWTCFSRQPGWGTALSPCRTSDSPCSTVNYAWCRKQLLTVLFIFDVLFVLHQWSTTLNNVLILISFFFFFPRGLQQHGIWRLCKPWWFKSPNQLVGSVSPPCYRQEADRHRQ